MNPAGDSPAAAIAILGCCAAAAVAACWVAPRLAVWALAAAVAALVRWRRLRAMRGEYAVLLPAPVPPDRCPFEDTPPPGAPADSMVPVSDDTMTDLAPVLPWRQR